MSTTYRADIDGLRAIAILAVVAFHAFPAALPGGFVGVDIFFVISGFLISRLILVELDAKRFSFLDFYARRIKRIFPILSVVLASAFLFGWSVLYSDAYGSLGKHIAGATAFVSNFVYLFESGYFDVDASAKPLLHLWSLAIEEQFYVVWPVLLVLARRTMRLTDAALLRLLLALTLASLAGCIYLTGNDASQAFYLPFTRFWELSLGGVTYLLTKHNGPHRQAARWWPWLGLGLLASAFWYIDQDAAFPGYLALLPCLATATLLGAPATHTIRKALSLKPVVFIGLTSYSLYLWHWPALFFLRELVVNPTPLQRLACLALSFFLAVCGYVVIERPVRRTTWRGAPILLLCLMTLIGLVGLNSYQRNGLDFREVNGRMALTHLLHNTPDPLATQTPGTTLRFDLDPTQLAQLAVLQTRLRRDSAALQNIMADANAINHQGVFCSGRDADDTNCAASTQQAPLDKRVVLVAGDSHAGNFLQALTLAYPDVNFVSFIDGGCVPISQRYKNPATPCAKAIWGAMAYVQNHPVDLVLLASRWLASFEEITPDIAHYRKHVGKVALVGPSLTFVKDVYRILSDYAPPTAFDAHVQESFEQRNVSLNAAMRAFAVQQGASYIDKISLFCQGGPCPLFRNQQLLIFDKGHLTGSGAAHLAAGLSARDALSAIVQSPQPVVVAWAPPQSPPSTPD